MSQEKLVRRQFAPFFKVMSKGVCIEYTDKPRDGWAAYNQASDQDKQIFKLDATGQVVTVLARSRF